MTTVTKVADGLGNESTDDFRLPGGPHQDHVLMVGGNLDGGTIVLQAKAPDGSYIDVDGASFTENTTKVLSHLPMLCRLTVSGGGASVAADAWVQAGGYR